MNCQSNISTETLVKESKYHGYRHPFLDLYLSIANGFISSKLYDKRDDFDFETVNFPFWMVTFLAVLHFFIFCNLLGLLESAIMSRTTLREINI